LPIPELGEIDLAHPTNSAVPRKLYFGIRLLSEPIVFGNLGPLHTQLVEEGAGDMGFDLNCNAMIGQKRLSQREIAIIALIAEGQTNKAIAVQLGVAPETIKTYLKRIFIKLGTHSRAEAVVLAQTTRAPPAMPVLC
jgi:DNA-binding CsgD family transcriptional regulator